MESDEDYRERMLSCINPGAWRTAEDIGNSSGEDLDAIGDRVNCKRGGEE